MTGESLAAQFECRHVLRIAWHDLVERLMMAGKLPSPTLAQKWGRSPTAVSLRQISSKRKSLAVAWVAEGADPETSPLESAVDIPLDSIECSLRSLVEPIPFGFECTDVALWFPDVVEFQCRRGAGRQKHKRDPRPVRPCQMIRRDLYDHAHLLMAEVWPWYFLGFMQEDRRTADIFCRYHDADFNKAYSTAVYAPAPVTTITMPAYTFALGNHGRLVTIYAAMCTCRRIYWMMHIPKK